MPSFGQKFSENRGAWAGTIHSRQPRVRLELPIWVLRWLNLLNTRGSLKSQETGALLHQYLLRSAFVFVAYGFTKESVLARDLDPVN